MKISVLYRVSVKIGQLSEVPFFHPHGWFNRVYCWHVIASGVLGLEHGICSRSRSRSPRDHCSMRLACIHPASSWGSLGEQVLVLAALARGGSRDRKLSGLPRAPQLMNGRIRISPATAPSWWHATPFLRGGNKMGSRANWDLGEWIGGSTVQISLGS